MAPSRLSSSSAATLDAALSRATADPYRDLPRIVLLAAPSTSLLYSGAAGFLRLPAVEGSSDGAEPVSAESIFDEWSCTKLVTVIAVLQFVERGIMRMQDDASTWLEELTEVKLFAGFREDGELLLEENEVPLTVEHLVCHTAGLDWEDPRVAKIRDHLGLADVDGPDATREPLTKTPLLYKRGTRWPYGTSNDWLGLLIEAVSGLSLEGYFQSQIFQPFGITDTSFLPNPSMIPMASPFHDVHLFAPVNCFSETLHHGGAGLTGSPASYLHLLRMLLGRGTLDDVRILSPTSVDSMFVSRLSTEQANEDVQIYTKSGCDPFTREAETLDEGAGWGYGRPLSGRELESGRIVWKNTAPYGTPALYDIWEAVEPELYKGLEEMEARQRDL